MARLTKTTFCVPNLKLPFFKLPFCDAIHVCPMPNIKAPTVLNWPCTMSPIGLLFAVADIDYPWRKRYCAESPTYTYGSLWTVCIWSAASSVRAATVDLRTFKATREREEHQVASARERSSASGSPKHRSMRKLGVGYRERQNVLV